MHVMIRSWNSGQVDVRLVQGPVEYEPPPLIANGGGESTFLGRTRSETHPEHGALTLLR